MPRCTYRGEGCSLDRHAQATAGSVHEVDQPGVVHHNIPVMLIKRDAFSYLKKNSQIKEYGSVCASGVVPLASPPQGHTTGTKYLHASGITTA
jgi:hypothetical protein